MTTFDYTFPMYLEGITSLADRIQSDRYPATFDYVVGLARGGAIPAVHISHMMNIPCRIVHWSLRDHIHQDISPLLIRELLFSRVLLVDDIMDSGKTIEGFMEFMDVRRSQLTIASLISRKESSIQPDYVHVKDPEGWVKFWWET